jgi:hypothetical protein
MKTTPQGFSCFSCKGDKAGRFFTLFMKKGGAIVWLGQNPKRAANSAACGGHKRGYSRHITL